VSDTPRTEAEVNRPHGPLDGIVTIDADFAAQLERELNEANDMFRKLNIHTLNLTDRIKRLEEAGDALANTQTYDLLETVNWRKAKEAKP